MLQTPQVFPVANLMNPFSPHDPPQEFLIHHEPPLTPTKVTPWLSLLLQLLKTPDEYLDQLVASTATAIGLSAIALLKALQDLTSVYPLTLNGPVWVLHACLTALYGYSSS